LWKFGDGNTSTLPNPTHTYAVAGNYNVTLIAIGAFGTDSITKNISIFSTPPASCAAPTVPPYQVAAGILNVQFSNINHSSLDAPTEGYQDFTCSVNAAVITIGQPQTIVVQTFSQQQQQVAVWIDWNANTQLEATERINLTLSSPTIFTANITAPQGAIINTPLRMRILQDVPNITSNVPCYNIANGQAEDYTLIVVPSNTPPIAAFSVDTANICGNPLQFNNLSTGSITNFLWKFGDGNTSTAQNPSHNYANAGTYTVTLIVSGSLGTDSVSHTLVRNELPIATSCTAPSAFANNQTGIRRVVFQSINHSTGSSTEGYKNFTCLRTNVTVGQTYPISITAFSNFEQVAVWIDYNNNGNFEITERVIYSQTPTLINPPRHNATINIPTGTVLNTPLRMRVIAAGVVNANSACGTVNGGQAEDYSIVVQAANIPPTANFKVDTSRLCVNDTIYFLHQSSGNISSYFWDFGNGQSSTAENPSVVLAAGTYDVKLKVSGSLGSDSIIKSIQVLQKPIPTTCIANTSTSVAQVGIQRFVFANIDHTSSNASVEGYQDFSCYIQSEVNAATSYPIQIRTINNQERAAAWIDYNNDGNFTASEQVFLSNVGSNTHNGTVTIPTTAVFDVPLRMRVISRVLSLPNGVPCIGLANGQAEDYGIIIRNFTSIITTKNNLYLGNLDIFPNPNSGIFTVKYQLEKERKAQLEIANTIGKVVRTMPIFSDNNEIQIELKDHSKGIYFVRLITETQTVVKKIVIQ
jgi:PKD repeat protein